MKKLFALLTLILTAATLARSGRDGERAYLYDPRRSSCPKGSTICSITRSPNWKR